MAVTTLLIQLLMFGASAFSDMEKPARKPSELQKNLPSEEVLALSGAKVLAADYHLLRRDFPELRTLPEAQIDQWLIENSAFISIPQASQQAVNTNIPTEPRTRTAFRPAHYNRALVFVAGSGLLDSKGNGSLNPTQGDHSNGLATTGEVLREYVLQKAIQHIFEHSKTGTQTVGSYAVLDLGFRIIHPDGSTSPAGSIVRQAAQRTGLDSGSLHLKDQIRIEKILRRYGVTSAGAYRREHESDWLNIQGTKTGAVVDFGGYLVVDEMRPTAPFGKRRPLLDSSLQPEPQIRLPYELWGSSVTSVEDPKKDNLWIWSHELAESLAANRCGRDAVKEHLDRFLPPLQSHLARHPQPNYCRQLFK